jgi:hypothetical protein
MKAHIEEALKELLDALIVVGIIVIMLVVFMLSVADSVSPAGWR